MQRQRLYRADENSALLKDVYNGQILLPKEVCETYADDYASRDKDYEGEPGWGDSILPVQADGTIDPSSPYVVSPSGQGYYPVERVNAHYSAVWISAGFPGVRGTDDYYIPSTAIRRALDNVGAYEGGEKLVEAVENRMDGWFKKDRGTKRQGFYDAADPFLYQHCADNYTSALEYGDLF